MGLSEHSFIARPSDEDNIEKEVGAEERAASYRGAAEEGCGGGKEGGQGHGDEEDPKVGVLRCFLLSPHLLHLLLLPERRE